MKRGKGNRHLNVGAFLLMPCYLLIVVLHLFFIPKFQNEPATGSRTSFTKNTQTVYYLVRNDRSMWNDKLGIKISPKVRLITPVTATSESPSIKIIFISKTCLASISVAGHYAWLYNRSIKT
jgi:hypothetical protein